MKVAIVGCGGSCGAYLIEGLATVEVDPNKHDQVWALNHMCLAIKHDLGIIIDDIPLVKDTCPVLHEYMETTETPYLSAFATGTFKSNQQFPLDVVVTAINDDLLNNVGCYAIAYAIAIGVERMTLFGMDYFWDMTMNYERGGPAVAYLIGLARGRGIEVNITAPSPMLQTNTVRIIDGRARRQLHGYTKQPAMGHLPGTLGIETERAPLSE